MSPSGSGSTCTRAAPCALATALASASAAQHIYLRPGDYNAVTTSWQVSRVLQFYGGFGNDAAWTRVADRVGNQAKINGGGTFGGEFITIRVAPASGTLGSALSPVKFVDLYINGLDVPALTENNGKSSYALYAKSAFVEINRCTITGKNGRNGSNGYVGRSPGGDGQCRQQRRRYFGLRNWGGGGGLAPTTAAAMRRTRRVAGVVTARAAAAATVARWRFQVAPFSLDARWRRARRSDV